MKEKAFNNSVQAEIEAAKLRELYDRLDDESNKDYFSTLLYGYKS